MLTSQLVGNETLVLSPMECFCEGEFRRFCVTPLALNEVIE